MRNLNLELKIRNLKFQILECRFIFPVNCFQNKDYKTLQCLYTTKIKLVEVNFNFWYPLEASENLSFWCFQGAQKGILTQMGSKTTISVKAQFDVINLKR